MSAVRLQNVAKGYLLAKRRVEVLRDVSCEIPEGKLTTVQGASGSGKSTLLHVIGGLDRPSQGEVFVAEQSLYGLGRSALSRFRSLKIGFVFQAYHLLPELSALENVMLPALIARRHSRDKAAEILTTVGLADRMEHRPWELSGGEQQRVAIARSLMNDPALILADEPTGNLDSKTGVAILDLFIGQIKSRGLTAIVVTHDERVAERGDLRLKLADGQLG